MLPVSDNVLDGWMMLYYYYYYHVPLSVYSQVVRCGKYKDVTESGVGSPQLNRPELSQYLSSPFVNSDMCLSVQLQVDFNSRSAVTAERQTFYCVPIPGENAWVKEISFVYEEMRPSSVKVF